MTKHGNGLSDAWDCEIDCEELESPRLSFDDQRPEDGQKCLVWPQERVLVYDFSLDGFVAEGLHKLDSCPVQYWMPLPDAPLTYGERVEYIKGSLADVFSNRMQPLIGKDVEYFRENLLTALGTPEEYPTAEEPPRVTDVKDAGNGRVEFDLEIPGPFQRYSGTYAAEDDTDGNDC